MLKPGNIYQIIVGCLSFISQHDKRGITLNKDTIITYLETKNGFDGPVHYFFYDNKIILRQLKYPKERLTEVET